MLPRALRSSWIAACAVLALASFVLADGRVSNAKSSVYRDGIWDNGAGPVYIYYYQTNNPGQNIELRQTNLTLAQAQTQYNNGTVGFRYYDNNNQAQNYAGANANTMQDHNTNYGWNANFSIFCQPALVQVDVHVNFDWSGSGLNAGQQTTLRNSWESGIEDWWSHRYGINDGTVTRDIVFDLRFDQYAQAPLYDQNVTVHPGSGRADLANWYVTDAGATPAHEFGHMIGAFDEYWGGALAPTLLTDYSNLMGTVSGLTSGQGLKSLYFNDILAAFTGMCSPGTNNTLVAVPTPGGLALLGLGGVFAVRRRRA